MHRSLSSLSLPHLLCWRAPDSADRDGEVDTRSCYTALVAARLLNMLTPGTSSCPSLLPFPPAPPTSPSPSPPLLAPRSHCRVGWEHSRLSPPLPNLRRRIRWRAKQRSPRRLQLLCSGWPPDPQPGSPFSSPLLFFPRSLASPHCCQSHRIDLEGQRRWLLHMQTRQEGGFRGRTNKLVDSCYSYWQVSLPLPPLPSLFVSVLI
jgi:hypothetical protein